MSVLERPAEPSSQATPETTVETLGWGTLQRRPRRFELPKPVVSAYNEPMKLLDLTLQTPSENLALDEALLDQAVAGGGDVLRLWESAQTAVVLGRASQIDIEVDRDYCDATQIPVLRRCSGGAAVMIGPGCLMYSVILNTAMRPEFADVDLVHRYVLGQIRDALHAIDLPVQISGTSDLTLDDRKFSGNSLRIKRNAFLYHGTLLYDAAIDRIQQSLRKPPREPDYRQQRSHGDFLSNLPTSADAMRGSLQETWQCKARLPDWPRDATRRLVQERYESQAWTLQR